LTDKLPYPAGYTHDLSLITANEGSELPDMFSAPRCPTITSWASYEEVLDGGEVFVCNLKIGIPESANLIAGYIRPQSTQRVIVDGIQYTWQKKAYDESRSLLWHSTIHQDSVKGYSGTVICLGNPTDRFAKAVVFQNFEGTVKLKAPEEVRCMIRESVGMENRDFIHYKGGFFLPQTIRNAQILMKEHPDRCKQYDTLPISPPVSPSASKPVTPQRRSFSSPTG